MPFIGSCISHSETDLDEVADKHHIEVEKKHIERYMLLFKTFLVAKKWWEILLYSICNHLTLLANSHWELVVLAMFHCVKCVMLYHCCLQYIASVCSVTKVEMG